MLTTRTSHLSLREKTAVKKKRTQKAGAATRPAQNIETCKIHLESLKQELFWKPQWWKAGAGPPWTCSQKPRWIPLHR